MCITKKEQWVYDGKSYDEEVDAVKAALTSIGTRFVKEFHSKPLDGMLELGADISELRIRYLELTCGPAQAGVDIPVKALGEPKSGPVNPVLKPIQDRRDEVRRRIESLPPGSPIIDAIAVHLKDEKWPTKEAFLVHADGQQLQFVERLLSIGKV